MSDQPVYLDKGAVISACGNYRYRLWREWRNHPAPARWDMWTEDDGLPARMAGTRVAVGGPRGTSAASLIVEAYGDAVVPQIPEVIGRAILRVERAMAQVL